MNKSFDISSIRVVYIDYSSDRSYDRDIFSLVYECDGDFVPSLSSRYSDGANKAIGVAAAIEDMGDECLLALHNNNVVGLMSFRDNYRLRYISSTGIYIDTLCVSHDMRCVGIGWLLYKSLENIARERECKAISTRTWSTNDAQVHILTKRGYNIINVIRDDRKPGVDTLYYSKNISR